MDADILHTLVNHASSWTNDFGGQHCFPCGCQYYLSRKILVDICDSVQTVHAFGQIIIILFVQDHACALLGIARLHEELLTTLGNFIKPLQMNCRFCHKSGLVILLFRFDLICMHGNFPMLTKILCTQNSASATLPITSEPFLETLWCVKLVNSSPVNYQA